MKTLTSHAGMLGMPRETNKIYHQSSMQIENTKAEGKRIMSETTFTEFPTLSVDPRVEISRYASVTDF